ncbi:MAG: hypothetical protein COU83_00010 [Candidatus Portnoybacteria bacterium CG10_big_fil_rev_8_21_14_0_10_40_22]|uniref:Peptidase C39-like domain-containing protein n=1 Tax=Candidatus Portnoybacteria bacterium CG10_big_fil_rev_8_21_14_0_10_40_22 TaxID=1974814 RepID=A0A2M8KH70_9BACT|nr:MAG: hypothetical protein COU83_00010 [Candidatus Portnoybacteria bacterium CG10_big_fil_rev_8_21_14_0_10_40_22]
MKNAYFNKFSIITSLILVVVLSNVLFKSRVGYASLVNEIDQQIQGAFSEQQKLEIQAQKYRALTEAKRKEIKSLNQELGLMQAEIDEIDNQIDLTTNKINQTNLELLKTQYDIEQKQAVINLQKQALSAMLRETYQTEQVNLLEIILQSDSLSDFFSSLVYLDTLQGAAKEALGKLQDVKQRLDVYFQDQDRQKKQLEIDKQSLASDKGQAQNQKLTREDLLVTTSGQEKEYQKILDQIEVQKKQILGDIDRLRQDRSQELARLEAGQQKPKEGIGSESWYFNQTNPKWGTTRIGLSRSLLKDYGCAVTSVAMVFKYYGADIDPGRLANQKIFWYNLIMWPDRWQGVELVLNTKHQGVDWSRIDQELETNHPVIIYIQAVGRGSGHYVVIHHKASDGRYVVHDPYWGPNLYLGSSEALLAKLYNTTTKIDQMIIYH